MHISVFCLSFSASLSKVHWTFFTSLPHSEQITVAARQLGRAIARGEDVKKPPCPRRQPRAPPFVPCLGIPCPPFPRLCPVPGRLRPPQWVVLRQGLQPVKKTIPTQLKTNPIKKNFKKLHPFVTQFKNFYV